MHFSVYYRLVDLLWDHLSDEELFRRLAREALERYIDYKSWQWNILRNEMDLPVYKAVYYFIHYAIRAFAKAMR